MVASAGMFTAGKGNNMSDEIEPIGEINETALALFLQDNDADQLTDILVAALNDALRILGDEIHVDTVH